MDDALFITWDELVDRIMWREDYYKKYKDTDSNKLAVELKEFNDVYLRIYTCEIIFGNTPPYDYENKRIDIELIESYRRFMEEHKDSEYCITIKRVYEEFDKNDFIYDEDVMNKLYIDIFGKRFDSE